MFSNHLDRDKDITIVKEILIKLVNDVFECERKSICSIGIGRIVIESKATDIILKILDLSNKTIFKSFQLYLSMEEI